MKYRCLNNKGIETQLTVGNIYEGKESENHKTYIGVPYLEIETADDGLNGIYNPYRFEEVK